jgi:2-keto-4-pentenoate hydratase/2-oxohepta-3-ene-1,7-dioic acid hydratase in catechol pathway
MRFVNHDGRLVLVADDGRGIDVARASGDVLPSDPAGAFDRWDAVLAWAAGAARANGDVALDERLLGPPSPRPRQILAIGLNYATHAAESGLALPDLPMVFTKLQASLAGPFDEIAISTDTVDWEIELVVVLGRAGRNVAAADAWSYVAGLTAGQDVSERTIQLRPPETPQFTLGKSLPGFGPTGPALVTPDGFSDRDDLELVCRVNGEEVQCGRTSDFIFGVPRIVEYLSSVTALYPGDLIFTGTPSGVGAARRPPRYLAVGDVLESEVEGIGTMRNRFVADGAAGVGAGAAVGAGTGADAGGRP